MIRSIILMLVAFLVFGCTASIQTPIAAPPQKQGMFLKNGDCNLKAEEATIALCKMGKKVELLEKQLADKTAEKSAKPAAPPMPVELPGFNHVSISTGVACTSQAPLTLEVTNSTGQFLEVEQVDGGMVVSECDRHMLVPIMVAAPNGIPRRAWAIPPHETAAIRFVAVVYTQTNTPRGSVLQGRLGKKSVKFNAYMPMGTDPAPRVFHSSWTYDFPYNRGYTQTFSTSTMWPG